MICFQTITQFINTDIDTDDVEYNNKKYNKNACHFFALKTAKEFFRNKDFSKVTHETNINFAINMNKLYQNNEMYFDELIKFTDLKSGDINATTTELIDSEDYALNMVFPETTKSYCVIILKNSKFFNILFHNNNYYIRDCHEPFQYDFDCKNKMINHINEIYQFNKSINLDGYSIPEFSSIEYIIINNDFEFKLENVSDNKYFGELIKPKGELKETKFGLSIEKINYDELFEGNDKIIYKKKEEHITPIKKMYSYAHDDDNSSDETYNPPKFFSNINNK